MKTFPARFSAKKKPAAAGFALLEAVVAVAVMGVAIGIMAQMQSNALKATRSIEQRLIIQSVKSALLQRIDCAQTLSPLGNTCKQGSMVPLRDSRGNLILGAPGAGVFANSNQFGTEIYVRSMCDINHATLDVRMAMQPRSGVNAFATDALNGNKVYDFRAYPANPQNPIFGVSAGPSAPMCGQILNPALPPGGPCAVSPRICPAGQVSSGIDPSSCQVLCVPKAPVSACAAGQKVSQINADGTAVCSGETAAPDARVTNMLASSCPDGYVWGFSGTGAAKCRATGLVGGTEYTYTPLAPVQKAYFGCPYDNVITFQYVHVANNPASPAYYWNGFADSNIHVCN